MERQKTFKDLTGMKFGEWEALSYEGKSMWKCRCSCGNIKNVHRYTLITGKSTSCGHPIKEGILDIHEGMHIWNWDVLENLGYGRFRCRCICGKESVVNISSLRYGYSKSCGCRQGEYQRASLLEKYGEAVTNKMDTPREKWQIDAVYTKENMQQYITELTAELGRSPTTQDLSSRLGINRPAILKKIHKFGLEEIIDLYEFTSNGENEIRDFIKSIYDGEVVLNSQSIIQGKELDIYLPEKKLAIEYNGSYWHCEDVKGKKYHQDKTIACAKLGIRLIHIFDYEWSDTIKQGKLKNIIKMAIKPDDNIIRYARKLKVAEITSKEAIEFCNRYHIDNGIAGKIHIGLLSDTEILGVLVLGKPRYQNTDEDTYEIYRMAFKFDTVIPGGLNRMFKYFVKEYKPSKVITYIDISKFSGNGYSSIGFKSDLSGITRPGYVWKHSYKDTVLTRYQTTKKKLIDLGYGDKGTSEDVIMSNLGYLKVYNSGNLRMEWTENEQ